MVMLQADRTRPGEGRETSQRVESLPLILEAARATATWQPVTVGLPVPRGVLRSPEGVTLRDASGQTHLLQGQVLAFWSDGSIRWLLLDFLVPPCEGSKQQWLLSWTGQEVRPTSKLRVRRTPEVVEIETGVAQFLLDPVRGTLGGGLAGAKGSLLAPGAVQWMLTDPQGRSAGLVVDRLEMESVGPVRATLRLEGRFQGKVPARLVTRLSFYAGTALVRLETTIHNPQRAKHPGGLWDLGDAGSLFFRDLSLQLALPEGAVSQLICRTQPDQPVRVHQGTRLEIYQDSSGGENWNSPNHVNREGRIPISFRGYRVRLDAAEETGERASPILGITTERGCLSLAVRDFWQQFPKALEVNGNRVFARLFPGQFADLFELQGGEQKTHTLWLDLASPPDAALDWVADPVHAHFEPSVYIASGVVPHLYPAPGYNRFEEQVTQVIEGSHSFWAGREAIDEYGWRNYGEVFADHEEEHYQGPRPFISHYNNQYDLIQGLLLQYLRSGEKRWLDLAGPLARHVADIDIYHTQEDKAAYNGGLFWFTDHYLTAHTCTHRTYSRHNQLPRKDYGGGPSSNHLFSTGLVLYYYLTGDPLARDAAVELANWVVAMDDGSRNVLGLIDPGPTGAASFTGDPLYHGPGRGSGNSINTLLDGWLLTGKRAYLDKAEALIRRSIHPEDDVDSRQLLEVEKRWSYTVHLSTLARYLDLKEELGERDGMYAYAQAALLRYGAWMLEHEQPYFDHPERLEYPTEAWAGQELRKANVLRLAAEHAPDPLRSRLLQRGQELSDRAWDDLYRFPLRSSARGQALVLAEGPRDDAFRRGAGRQLPSVPGKDFPPAEAFVPQKQRVLRQLRRPRGVLRVLLGLMHLGRWWHLARATRRSRNSRCKRIGRWRV